MLEVSNVRRSMHSYDARPNTLVTLRAAVKYASEIRVLANSRRLAYILVLVTLTRFDSRYMSLRATCSVLAFATLRVVRVSKTGARRAERRNA